jgi:hypothetical protein
MLHPRGEPFCHDSLRFGTDCGFVSLRPEIAPVIQARLQIIEPGGGGSLEIHVTARTHVTAMIGRRLASP